MYATIVEMNGQKWRSGFHDSLDAAVADAGERNGILEIEEIGGGVVWRRGDLAAAVAALGTVDQHFRVAELTGPHQARTRQTLMALLTGETRPAAKCGVTALRDEFYRRAGIAGTGECHRQREKSFTEFCRKLTAE